MSYTCFTRAGFFASWLNSLSFQSDLVYTSCASASLPAVPNVASAATLVVAILTNDLRFILIVFFRSWASLYLFVFLDLLLFHDAVPVPARTRVVGPLSGNFRMNVSLVNLTPHLSTDDERRYCRQILIAI